MNAIGLINSYQPKPARSSASELLAGMAAFDWDTPPKNVNGDTDIASLFIAVGYTLTVWEEMDARLGKLFWHACRKTGTHSPDNYFYTINADGTRRDRTLNNKANRLRSEISKIGDSGLNDVVCSLAAELAKAAKRRNDISHGVVQSISHRMGEMQILSVIYLVSKEEFLKFPYRLTCALTSLQIVTLGHKFRDLRGCVDDLSDLILPPIVPGAASAPQGSTSSAPRA